MSCATESDTALSDVDSGTRGTSEDASGLQKEISLGEGDGCLTMVWSNADWPSKGITSFEAFLSLLTAIIGAGIMALPQVPKGAGIYPCIVLCIASAVAVSESGNAWFKAQWAWNKVQPESEKLETFEDFGAAAYGKAGALAVRIPQLGILLGTASGYAILIAKQLQHLSFEEWNYRMYILCTAPILWFLCMLRDLSALAKLMPLGAVAAVASCLLLVVKAIGDQDAWEDWSQEDIDKVHSYWPEHGFMPVGSVVATLFGAYGVMQNIPAIASEMRKPHRLPRSLKSAILTVSVLYLLIICLGYWGYGNFIQDNIILSMSKSPANAEQAFNMKPSKWTRKTDGMLADLMSWCVLVNMLMSYPLLMTSAFVSFQGLECASPRLLPGTFLNYIMRTSLVALTLLIAAAVEDFGVLFALFSSVFSPIIGVFIPILFGAKIRKKIGAKGPSCFRWFVHSLIMILALFCLCIGFVDSVQSLINSFG